VRKPQTVMWVEWVTHKLFVEAVVNDRSLGTPSLRCLRASGSSCESWR
jgi:hypothetical protein